MTRADGKVAIYVVITPELKANVLQEASRVGSQLSNLSAQLMELGYRVWLEEGQNAFEARGM